MPTPTIRQADNGVFYVHWTEGRRSKRESTYTKSKDEAQTYLAHWILDNKDGTEAAPETFKCAELWALYRKKHGAKLVAPLTLDNSWKNLGAHFGDLKLSAVSQDTVDAYEAKRTSGRLGRKSKPATVRRELIALRACFNWCAAPKQALVKKELVPAFSLPAAGEPRDRWLKTEEIRLLLDAAKKARPVAGDRMSRVERFLWLALETAARKAAILDLTWDRVDFETGMIHYEVPGRARTKKRRANVPISRALLPVLKRAFDERVGPLVMDNKADVWRSVQLVAGQAGLGGSGWVKPKRNGMPAKTGVSPHVMRHTAATHMARRGVPLYTIAGVLGNTLAVVESVYAKHSKDALSDAVNMISGDL